MNVAMTPRRALHFAAIAMAVDAHCHGECIHCQGNGRLFYPETMQKAVCPYCDGFGQRELKPARPRYTVHGVMPSSILNMGPVA